MENKYKPGDIIKEVDVPYYIFDEEDARWYRVLGITVMRISEGDVVPAYEIETIEQKANGETVKYTSSMEYLEAHTELVTNADWILNGPTDR